jgi:hypothetical protein
MAFLAGELQCTARRPADNDQPGTFYFPLHPGCESFPRTMRSIIWHLFLVRLTPVFMASFIGKP